MRVRIDPERCQGHARCYDLAPGLFGDDDEGYGQVLGDGTVPPGQEPEESDENSAGAFSGKSLPRT